MLQAKANSYLLGGTTTDIGVLVNSFPRESSVAVEIGDIRTNFRMPDLISIGLGGGSIVKGEGDKVIVGPESVGYRLTEEALLFGGNTLTATDIAVKLGAASFGDPSRLERVNKVQAESAYKRVEQMFEDAVDRMKTSAQPVPVIAVGGGSILVPDKLKDVSEVIRPDHFEVANAIGAAIAQVSGQVERIFSLDAMAREEALAQARKMAVEEAVKAGAEPDSIEIVEVDDVPLAYLPGNATRIRVKAAGNLKSA